MDNEQYDSFDESVRQELHRQWPRLTDEFIRSHQSELVEFLEKRGSVKDNSIDSRARSISDNLPEELFKGMSVDSDSDSDSDSESKSIQSTDPKSTQMRLCMELLNIYMRKVLNGEVESLCVQAIKPDGNMEMLFTLPCNIYAYYGLMTHILATQTQYKDPSSEE